MKPYSSYKDSGVEWIGKIPNGWTTRKGKYLFQIKKTISGEEGYDVLSVTQQGIKIKDIISGKGQLSMDYTKYQIVNIGDFVMNHMDLLTGYVDISNYFGVTSPDYRVFFLTDKQCVERYYLYLLQMGYKNKIFYGFGQGSSMFGRWRLPSDEFNNFRHPYPDVQEQKQIVSFLDHKTQKIDELIEQTEKKIELLKEQRISLINHCVTKGLNPNVKMKDSGVEWIGEIPRDWNISKVKFEFSFVGGGTPSKENDEYWDGDIPWVSPKDMKSVDISSSGEKITERGLTESSTNLIDKDSLLIVVRSGILQRTIPVGINTIPVTINQDLKSLKPKRDIQIKFFYYFIKGNETNLLTDWSKEGTTVESIEMEFMSNSRIPVPSSSEQQQIVEYLDEHTGKIHSTIEKETQRIELLKEYRQSLISEVVTGKIDVRDWNNGAQKLS